jgi:hypothetical protein
MFYPMASLLVGARWQMAARQIETVTHVAGPWMVIGDRIIQRCPICGVKLIDMYCSSPKNLPDHVVWSEGAMIHIDEGKQRHVGEFLNKKKMPDDFCIWLVELEWP